MTSIHCAKSPDLKPIDNLWAYIKPDLSRNTQGNVIDFEITIPWHLESDSHQKVQSMLSRIQNCLNTRGRYTRYDVVFRSVVIDFIVDIFAVDVCYLEKCYLQYQFCLNVTKHGYCF